MPLTALSEAYGWLRRELIEHMTKEERVLFPWIRSGAGVTAGGPIRCMEAEHTATGTALAEMRRVSDDYTLPATAERPLMDLWGELQELERELLEHIHLENDILFPRTLRGEAP